MQARKVYRTALAGALQLGTSAPASNADVLLVARALVELEVGAQRPAAALAVLLAVALPVSLDEAERWCLSNDVPSGQALKARMVCERAESVSGPMRTLTPTHSFTVVPTPWFSRPNPDSGLPFHPPFPRSNPGSLAELAHGLVGSGDRHCGGWRLLPRSTVCCARCGWRCWRHRLSRQARSKPPWPCLATHPRPTGRRWRLSGGILGALSPLPLASVSHGAWLTSCDRVRAQSAAHGRVASGRLRASAAAATHPQRLRRRPRALPRERRPPHRLPERPGRCRHCRVAAPLLVNDPGHVRMRARPPQGPRGVGR